MKKKLQTSTLCLASSLGFMTFIAPPPIALAAPAQTLEQRFAAPSDDARPWVYWYFMDGNVTREGIHADLEAMKKAGIGGAIYLEVNVGVPRGSVAFMSEPWQELFAYAVSEAKRLGLELALGTGPGWAGSGGPWVKPELSMQHLVSSETSVAGPTRFDAVLPRPQPRTPTFGEKNQTPELREQWLGFYRDETVLAFPTPEGKARLAGTDQKALYYRAPYSSSPSTPPRIPAPIGAPALPAAQVVDAAKIVVLTEKMGADGRLNWEVPPGNWTIMRFGRTPTGITTRPAPAAGVGFESDKFSRVALDAHLKAYTDVLFGRIGPQLHNEQGGLAMLHFDSWEMGSQNWSPEFKQEFIQRRGYDPTPFLPAMSGYIVGSVEQSERFLCDLRQTASDLVIANHALRLQEYAHQHDLKFSVEPYDLNPIGDLDLGATADLPMGEFWSQGFGYKTEYSVFEAVSVGHTNGKNIIGAESFTANGNDAWLQNPSSMKDQLDWALCAGINKFVIHTYQHQPDLDKFPGMTMGQHGVHWERTQTWWDMVPAFHRYIARSSEMLRQGLPVADVLYLTPEGVPQVFTPPVSALTDGLPDHKGYSFDGISPRTLMERATVKNGQIVFPDGTSYRVLVLPQWKTMTPQLLQKITQLVRDGATVVGNAPLQSPSLSDFPRGDAQVRALSAELWGAAPFQARRVGKGRIVPATTQNQTPLQNARWIWLDEPNPAKSASPGTRFFRKTFELAPGRSLQSAILTLAADNSYRVSVNGSHVGAGDSYQTPGEHDVAAQLKPGNNEITVEAVNGGDAPNPAGLIAALELNLADGSKTVINSDRSWSAASERNGPQTPALELGTAQMAPWNLGAQKAALYPEYDFTARLLKSMGVAPDFAADAPLRFIHRRLPDGDLYFVANASDQPLETTASFRVTGRQPQWWDALTGEVRDLPVFFADKATTRLPLNLAPHQSGFVMFRKPLAPRGTTGNKLNLTNFPRYQPVVTLARPWNVSFDPRWGGPQNIVFPALENWTKRPEPGIKYYSGKAVYSSEFDFSANAAASATRYRLSLGAVKNMASVKLNGRDLGVVWCAPWSLDVPASALKPAGNRLEITVANLWTNRLLGDQKLPKAERLTSTTFAPLKATIPLQPSGLLGPVTLQRAE